MLNYYNKTTLVKIRALIFARDLCGYVNDQGPFICQLLLNSVKGRVSGIFVLDDHQYLAFFSRHVFAERDVAQWLKCGALSMSLPAARVRGSPGARFSEKYYISPPSTLGHCGINVVSLGKALYPQVLHFTQV